MDTGYAYDGNGNPTTYKTTACTFDAESRMTAYGTALTNGYRGDSLRGWKQASGGVKDYFLYDGEQLLGDFNSSGVYSNLYTTGANGLLSRRNVAPAVTTFYTFDLQGNVVQTMLADQSPHTEYWFDAYGGTGTAGPFVAGAPYANFGGQWGYYSDSETGLELLTHRFYDRGTGRFITRDPIGYDGGINLYGYTGNDPVNGSDPDGYAPVISDPAPGTPTPQPPSGGPQPIPLPSPPFPPDGTVTPPNGPVTFPTGGGPITVPFPPGLGGPGGPPVYTHNPFPVRNPIRGQPISVQPGPLPITFPIRIPPTTVTVPIGQGPVAGGVGVTVGPSQKPVYFCQVNIGI